MCIKRATDCICVIFTVLHVFHLFFLWKSYDEVQVDSGNSASLIDHYLNFVAREWSESLITEIYLETGKDSLVQKSCNEPLFTKKWGGIVPYTYIRYGKDNKGK